MKPSQHTHRGRPRALLNRLQTTGLWTGVLCAREWALSHDPLRFFPRVYDFMSREDHLLGTTAGGAQQMGFFLVVCLSLSPLVCAPFGFVFVFVLAFFIKLFPLGAFFIKLFPLGAFFHRFPPFSTVFHRSLWPLSCLFGSLLGSNGSLLGSSGCVLGSRGCVLGY